MTAEPEPLYIIIYRSPHYGCYSGAPRVWRNTLALLRDYRRTGGLRDVVRVEQA